MALRDYTLSNMMIWGGGALFVVGCAGTGAATWLGAGAPSQTPPAAVAAAGPASMTATPSVLSAKVPSAPVVMTQAELPRLHASPSSRSVAHLPVPPRPAAPRPVPQPARARMPVYPVVPSAPAPSYAPPAHWQRTYVAGPYPMPYYAYAPRYRDYGGYPGY